VFLWVHYFDPHDVLLLPPVEFIDPKKLEGVQRTKLRAIYDEEIRFMDRELGRLLDAVRTRDGAENSIVVVVADHGEGLGDHEWWTHGILYQEQIRVPLIITAPGAPAGRRVEHTVRTVDIAPTLLDLAGFAATASGTDDDALDGRSLVALFDENARDPEFTAYSDSFSPMTYQTPTLDPMIVVTDARDEILVSLVRAPYKYIHHHRVPSESELYRLDTDPGESLNLARREPEVAERMRAELAQRDWQPAIDAPSTPMTREEIERLRALGYLGEPEPVDSEHVD
jgi:arylsulfatase A-like enzyme